MRVVGDKRCTHQPLRGHAAGMALGRIAACTETSPEPSLTPTLKKMVLAIQLRQLTPTPRLVLCDTHCPARAPHPDRARPKGSPRRSHRYDATPPIAVAALRARRFSRMAPACSSVKSCRPMSALCTAFRSHCARMIPVSEWLFDPRRRCPSSCAMAKPRMMGSSNSTFSLLARSTARS